MPVPTREGEGDDGCRRGERWGSMRLLYFGASTGVNSFRWLLLAPVAARGYGEGVESTGDEVRAALSAADAVLAREGWRVTVSVDGAGLAVACQRDDGYAFARREAWRDGALLRLAAVIMGAGRTMAGIDRHRPPVVRPGDVAS